MGELHKKWPVGGESTKHEKEAFILQVGLPVLLSLWTESISKEIPPQHPTLLTAFESANAQTQNLVHSGVRTRHLHPALGCSLSPNLCQNNLLLVKYSQVSDLPAQ